MMASGPVGPVEPVRVGPSPSARRLAIVPPVCGADPSEATGARRAGGTGAASRSSMERGPLVCRAGGAAAGDCGAGADCAGARFAASTGACRRGGTTGGAVGGATCPVTRSGDAVPLNSGAGWGTLCRVSALTLTAVSAAVNIRAPSMAPGCRSATAASRPAHCDALFVRRRPVLRIPRPDRTAIPSRTALVLPVPVARAVCLRRFPAVFAVLVACRIRSLALARRNVDRDRRPCFFARLLTAIKGKLNADQRAGILTALDGEAAVMQADEATHHREAEAGSLMCAIVIAAAMAAAGLEEGIAQLSEILCGDADARIGDGDAHAPRIGTQPEADATAIRRELHRIRQKIDQDLPTGALIGGNARQILRDVEIKRDIAALGLEAHQLDAAVGERGHVETGRGEIEIAAFDLRDIE